ncbi:GbsR/MarR family transcriptional regulator [Paenibacillus thalictri]|uniref:HTH-type transcriptional regulator n=1 Tax=Paenibacillus thalictri TaxID=2527873 RepID=A0A4Q9DCX6_9BACL|nr:GbsR/MarR family transcriptional regulator [Paenibacillus thalictri]TBL68554.1 GbsR/MarR family transcriptional regulator [Paenibacillus thalictri]
MDGMMRVEKARERVIDSVAKNMDLYGVTPSIGRLYGTIYFNDGPMTLEQMMQSLGMSKTSMSVGVKLLSDLKMLEKVWVKGERKDLYKAEDDWHQCFFDYFSNQWRKAIKMNMDAIRQSLKELEQLSEDPAAESAVKDLASQDIAKLNNALDYYRWLEKLVHSFETHEIFDFIPKINDSATGPTPGKE